MRTNTSRLIATSLLALASFAGASAKDLVQACAAKTTLVSEPSVGAYRCEMRPDCSCAARCDSGADVSDSCQVQPTSREFEVAAMTTSWSPLLLDVVHPPSAQPALSDIRWTCRARSRKSEGLLHGPPPTSEHQRAPPSR